MRFLNEQRHAVGPTDDLVVNFPRQLLAIGHVDDHGADLLARQSIEAQHRHVRLVEPRGMNSGLKVISKNTGAVLIKRMLREIASERGSIDPVPVLDEEGAGRDPARPRS